MRFNPGIERFFQASWKILMCSKIWETWQYMLSASVFSNLVWKDTNVPAYILLKEMLLYLTVDFRHTAPWSAVFSDKHHIIILSASAKLAYSFSSSLNFFLIFLFILAHLLNYYRSTFIPLSFQLLFTFLSLGLFGILLPVEAWNRFLFNVT